jgi:hypothetical protein
MRAVAHLLALFASMILGVRAHAQPVPMPVESLEVRVLNAQDVVVGKILDITGSNEYGQQRTVTLAIDETIKGDRRGQWTIRLLNDIAQLRKLKQESCRLLAIAPPGAEAWQTHVINLSDEKLAVPRSDFSMLRLPDEVIRWAYVTVHKNPEVNHLETFQLSLKPGSEAEKQYRRKPGMAGGVSGLVVPVDAGLEKRALEEIASKDLHFRLEGIRALEHFRSASNTERLKDLLDDPTTVQQEQAEFNFGVDEFGYPVRQQAFETLLKWGIQVAKPVTSKSVSRLTTIKTLYWQTRPSDADLVKLREAKALTVLHIDFFGMSDHHAELISQLKNLKKLGFRGETTANDERMRLVARMTNLEHLDVGMSRVTDEGLKALAALPKLKHLNVMATRVTDAGLKTLASMKSLKKVVADGSKVTRRGIAQVRKMRPDLVIDLGVRRS